MVIGRAALLAPAPPSARRICRSRSAPAPHRVLRADLTLAEMEREYIQAVLEKNRGHRGRKAEALGIDPKTLYNKLRGWGVSEES